MIDPTQPLEIIVREGAPDGNQNALKFDTPEKRQAFCKAYCEHISTGRSDESFRYQVSGIKLFKTYLKDFPVDFPSDMIEDAQAARFAYWEDTGMKGTEGKIKGYNSDSWKFNMSNRFKWKMREDVTTDDKEVVGPVVYMPKEEA